MRRRGFRALLGAAGLVLAAAWAPGCSGGHATEGGSGSGSSGGGDAAGSSGSGSSGSGGGDSGTVDSGAGDGNVCGNCTGTCTPTGCLSTLSSGPVLALLASDSTSVYWVQGVVGKAWTLYDILRTPSAGGAAVTLATGSISVEQLAPGATDLYWSNGIGVVRTPLGGGTGTTLVSSNTGQIFGVAVDSVNLYWSDLGCSGSCGEIPASIQRAALGGGTPTTLVSALQYMLSPVLLALDATSLYWVTNRETPAVVRMPLAGGAPSTLGVISGSGNGLAVDAQSVYWLDPGPGDVVRFDKSTGMTTVLASGQSAPWALAVDAENVYWTNSGPATGGGSGSSSGSGSGSSPPPQGTVMKVPRTGGTAVTLASGRPSPAAITVDATSVYWTEGWTVPASALVKLTPK